MVLPPVASIGPSALSEAALGQRSIVHYGGVSVPATRYDSLISELTAAVPGGGAPPDFDAYLEKVRRHADSITDHDVQALKDAGYSEDEIFEYTVSAAVAAGIERLNAGLETLR